jgi:hypothetical protein
MGHRDSPLQSSLQKGSGVVVGHPKSDVIFVFGGDSYGVVVGQILPLHSNENDRSRIMN